MSGISKSGFSLIEIMVVIGLIAALATMIVPAFVNLIPRSERKQFIARLNELTTFAWRQAVATDQVHMVFFNFKTKRITVSSIKNNEKELGPFGEPKGQPVRGAYLKTSLAIPAGIKIDQLLIEGVDTLERKVKDSAQAWFFIMPNGLAQNVIINMYDTKDKVAGKYRKAGLVLNPFSAQFSVYDEYKK